MVEERKGSSSDLEALERDNEAKAPMLPPSTVAPPKVSDGNSLKAALLVGLVVQNAALNVAARWSWSCETRTGR